MANRDRKFEEEGEKGREGQELFCYSNLQEGGVLKISFNLPGTQKGEGKERIAILSRRPVEIGAAGGRRGRKRRGRGSALSTSVAHERHSAGRGGEEVSTTTILSVRGPNLSFPQVAVDGKGAFRISLSSQEGEEGTLSLCDLPPSGNHA